MSEFLRVAGFVTHTRAEGPHLRAALWLQGCSIRCPACCNPEMFDPAGGRRVTVDSVVANIAAAKERFDIEGLTLLGGEPTEQLPLAGELARSAQDLGLGVIAFTGRKRAALEAIAAFAPLAASLDTLIDGPFDAQLPEPASGRRFLGSTNQALHHLTDRYAAPGLWRGVAQVEAHIGPDGRVHLHGFPRPAQAMLVALGRGDRDAVSEAHGEKRQAGARVLADEERARRVLDR